MKDLEQFITEQVRKIDQAWLDNEKPVKTVDGRQAVILDIDMSKVPNVLKGQVKNGNKMCDYKWDDTGKCIYASDEHSNPVKPSDKDDLVKAL